MPRVEKVSAKQVYETPVLTVYGTVHHITRGNNSRSGVDNPSSPFPNTGPV